MAEQGAPEKNYLEEIKVHEQREGDFEYVHLKTGENAGSIILQCAVK